MVRTVSRGCTTKSHTDYLESASSPATRLQRVDSWDGFVWEWRSPKIRNSQERGDQKTVSGMLPSSMFPSCLVSIHCYMKTRSGRAKRWAIPIGRTKNRNRADVSPSDGVIPAQLLSSETLYACSFSSAPDRNCLFHLRCCAIGRTTPSRAT